MAWYFDFINGIFQRSQTISSSTGVADADKLPSTNSSGYLDIAIGGTGAGTAAGARSNLGLGTIATQNADAVAITGGSVAAGLISTGSNPLVLRPVSSEGGQVTFCYTGNSSATAEGASTWNLDVDASNNLRMLRRNSSNVALTALSIAESTGNATFGSAVITGGNVIANLAAGTAVGYYLQSSSSNRWAIFKNNAAESGSNAGSDFVINRYTDAGAYLGTVLYVTRAAGTVSINGALVVGTDGSLQTTGNGSGSVAGNARGTGAVDLQTIRGAATQVASGNYSLVAGQSCTASGTASTALGNSTIAAATNSAALNASTQVASAANAATSNGYQSLARRPTEMVLATGQFAAVGDAQTAQIVLKATTTDAAWTELTLGLGSGATGRIALQNDSTIAFDLLFVARRTDVDDESASYRFTGVIDRNANAASTALVGTPTKTVIAEDSAAWDAQVSADTTNGTLRVEFQGEAGKTIRVVCFARLVEVIG